jgi:hypothetical protein
LLAHPVDQFDTFPDPTYHVEHAAGCPARR